MRRSASRAKRRARICLIRAAVTRTGPFAVVARQLLGAGPSVFPAQWNREANLGDALSPVLLQYMLNVDPLYVSRQYQGKLLGTGSILEHARPGDFVLGSGLIRDHCFDGHGVTFFAVRGPLSRKGIRNAYVPSVYGDPALLLPRYYSAKSPGRRYGVGLVPHYVDRVAMFSSDPGVATVDVRDPDWQRTIDLIVACDVIISSSLHGVILAEAYGVPAIWVEASHRVIGSGFKFRDYYASTGREVQPVRWSADLSAITARARPAPKFDLESLLDAAALLRDAIARSRR